MVVHNPAVVSLDHSCAARAQGSATNKRSVTSADQGGGKRRDASIKIIDLGQRTGFSAADNVDMQVPENLPTSTNSIAIFVVLCIFVFGGMAFAKFMVRRERE